MALKTQEKINRRKSIPRDFDRYRGDGFGVDFLGNAYFDTVGFSGQEVPNFGFIDNEDDYGYGCDNDW